MADRLAHRFRLSDREQVPWAVRFDWWRLCPLSVLNGASKMLLLHWRCPYVATPLEFKIIDAGNCDWIYIVKSALLLYLDRFSCCFLDNVRCNPFLALRSVSDRPV